VIPPIKKRPSEYQGYRSSTPERPITISTMPILLSTLITALGTRYLGIEGPSEESAWLVDRLTGRVYRCEASRRGAANCDAEIATGSIPDRPKP
jgi:hypothetical protein